MKRYLFLVVFVFGFILTKSYAQYFQTGQDPGYLKWRQINTENFQLIYPDYFEENAQKLASTLEKVYRHGSKTLGHKPAKISVILHTQTIRSNGLVAWAPKRSEFYTTPHQQIYAQDWLEQLAIHEFRHVVQIDKLNAEIPGIIKFLLGEQGTALVFGAYLPWWFTEGDAVVAETAFSKFGRGRLPSFLMEHKAQVVEKGMFTYDKAYNGSYKDFVPNHYKLGYYMVSGTRDKYGPHIWEKVLTNVGKNPFSLHAFNKQLKSETNTTKTGLYNVVFGEFENKWKNEDNTLNFTSFEAVSAPNKTFKHYRYNHFLTDTTFISYRTSFDKIPAFVEIKKDGSEKVLFRPGDIFEESVNYRGNWIIWSEQIPDFRWSHSGKSLIRLLNVKSKKQLTVQTDYKAQAPAISPGSDYIALVESDYSYNFYLSVYNLVNGELLHRIQTPENNYLFSPDWLNEMEIVVIMLTKQGKRLVKINLEDKEIKELYTDNLGEIKQIKVHKNMLYFISGFTGKDELFRLNLINLDIERISEARFGHAYPALNEGGNMMLLSNYTADGYRLIKFDIEKQTPVLLDKLHEKEHYLASKMAVQEKGIIDFNKTEKQSFYSTRYRKSDKLINFHSWAPAAIDPGLYEIRPGFSLMSQNMLGTSETTLGYRWDVSEKQGQFFANYSYKGWFPVFYSEISSGKRASSYRLISNTKNTEGEIIRRDTTLERFTWNQTNARLGFNVPLNLSRGVFNRLLQPEFKYSLVLYTQTPPELEQFPTGAFHTFSYRFYYHQLLKRSYRDLYPDFGIVLDANIIHSPPGTNLGNLVSGQGILYLPGIFNNHGIKIYGGAQLKKAIGSIGFSDVVKYPRGWSKINTVNLYSVSADYKMPLFYPDLSMRGIFYLKRVKTALFADYARLEGNFHPGNTTEMHSTSISSFGAECTGDFHFLRFYAPANLGIRVAYLPNVGRYSFDFLFSVDFTSL